MKRVMEKDAAMTEDIIAYNIIPLDAPSIANVYRICFLIWFCILFSLNDCYLKVKTAVSALKYFSDLPELPRDFFIPASRNADMLDFLQYVFGFQVCVSEDLRCSIFITYQKCLYSFFWCQNMLESVWIGLGMY